MSSSADAIAQLNGLRSTSPNVLFFIARSKNLNIVVYEGQLAGNALKANDPVIVYWLDIDPEYVKAARAKGIQSDRSELNTIEKQFAYGLSSEPIAGQAGQYKVKLVAFADRPVHVFYDSAQGKVRAQMTINGVQCDLVRVFVHSVDRFMNPLPKVVHVDLTGLDPQGNVVEERIIPK